jgi:hypothetical protein
VSRNASSLDRGRDRPRRALGKTDPGGGWLGVQLGQPGVLLLRRLSPGGPRGVAVAMFGHTGLGMLICRNEDVACMYIYEPASIFTHGSLDLIGVSRAAFSTVRVGNQIADSARLLAALSLPVAERR